MSIAKVLLVDDDQVVRTTVAMVLAHHDFDVTEASNVPEALTHITSDKFDVLLSDLHMPGAGDGLTVVSAMRHANPSAVTMLLSAFPEMSAATNAILLQADRIMVKPMDIDLLVDAIKHHLEQGPQLPRVVETVAAVLERTKDTIICDWLTRVHQEASLTVIDMSDEERIRHLPQLFRDLVHRLQSSKSLGSKELISASAHQYGLARRVRGYTAAMIVEEYRILQVSIFQTLQDNLAAIDFNTLLINVMSIADEINSQLGQAMVSYLAEAGRDDRSKAVESHFGFEQHPDENSPIFMDAIKAGKHLIGIPDFFTGKVSGALSCMKCGQRYLLLFSDRDEKPVKLGALPQPYVQSLFAEINVSHETGHLAHRFRSGGDTVWAIA